MHTKLSRTVLFLAILSFIASIPVYADTVPSLSKFLKADAVRLTKKSPVLSDDAKEFLLKRDGDKVKVWVFFTDKQVASKSAFEKQAASIVLSDKVLKRRAKVNLQLVLFADLPVVQNYVDKIVELGGLHRRTSKWQNGASFEISFDGLSKIESLPFVAEIRPIATFAKKPLPEIDIKRESLAPQEQSPDALDYGNSALQLAQINIQAMHNLGYHGEGITLAILDTGFRKSHEAFAGHYAEGRVLAEYDFIFGDTNTANEPIDDPNQWSHGTYIWSVSGGQHDGDIYGPAYKANFLLAKTEDVRSETPVEEDNWVAAVEWADSLGADVITSSLGYILWYDSTEIDGATAITTIQANMAASLGIVLCNAAGNYGPSSSSLIAPADAHDILTIGAVSSTGALASFSSRGPTYDGRIKPEVCARGVGTWAATSNTDSSYSGVSGTSLSTPLVAGAACLLVQARPAFPPTIIRQALMETASNAATPNNNFGWGIINTEAALGWGAEFSADVTIGNAPQTVQFTANTSLPGTAWDWTFGDGGTSTDENPLYQYMTPGTFDVSLTVQTAYGPVTNTRYNYIVLYGDTLEFTSDSAFAGQSIAISVIVKNSQELTSILIPFKYGNLPNAILDSVRLGGRTSYFEDFSLIAASPGNDRYAYNLVANDGGGAPPLAAGAGEVMKIFVTLDSFALGGQTAVIDTTSFSSIKLGLTTTSTTYTPVVFTGGIMTKNIMRGDCNRDFKVNILDLNYLINFIFRNGSAPITIQAGDNNQDLQVNITDLNYIINYIFRNGAPPPSP